MQQSLRLLTISVLLLQLSCFQLYADDHDALLKLKSMSLENLMDVTVFSASKKSESLANVAAAMHVITHEDIIRSGARTIPDLLRGVPGLSVSNIDAHSWAVSARGLGGVFSNKLLVLMDGRTLYTPMYSGVYWDMQDTLIEDIERIEIIRGPGATIWGANAVNGVINIITRNALDTAGGYLATGGGSIDNTLNARYGYSNGTLGWRVYGKHSERDNFELREDDGEHSDNWDSETGGFRIDWESDNDHILSLQGNIYQGAGEQILNFGNSTLATYDVDMAGGNLLAQWDYQIDEERSWQLQTYYDHYMREDGYFKHHINTWDISFNQRLPLSESNDLIWGGGYRYVGDDTSAGENVSGDPDSDSYDVVNLFVQNDWEAVDDRLHIILGSKFEHNDFSGFEVQPTLRLLWNVDANNSLWAAASRAVRTPSRTDEDIRVEAFHTTLPDSFIPGLGLVPTESYISAEGNPNFKTEEMIALELGYRSQINDDLSFDLALFYNEYENLRTQEAGDAVTNIDPAAPLVSIMIPTYVDNNMDGRTWGLEISSNWQVMNNWRLSGSYSWLRVLLDHSNIDADLAGESDEEETAEHQVSLKSYVDLPWNLFWDTNLYYFSDKLSADAHLRCDMRLAWQATENLELSLKGESLFDDEYLEYSTSLGIRSSAVPRNWYAELKYRF